MNDMLHHPPFWTIVRRLAEEKIDYIIIGGVAAILHGVLRATFDLDIVLDFSPMNVEKFVKILKEFNLSPLVPIDPSELMDQKKRKEWIEKKDAKVINFRDPEDNYALDVALIYNYQKIEKMEIEIKGVKVPVVTKQMLIDLKKKAGRDTDVRDVKNLEEVVSIL